MEEELDLWCAWLDSGSRSPQTVHLRRFHVESYIKWCVTNGLGIDVDSVSKYLAHRPWSQSSRRSIRTSISFWCEWRCATGRMEKNPVKLLPPVIPNRTLPRPCPEKIIAAAVESSTVRVRAMLRLAAEAGLRRAEIAVIRRDDFMQDLLGWSLMVHGKGRRDRTVPLTDSTWIAVQRQFEDVGPHSPWLFPSIYGGHLKPIRVGELISEALPVGWAAHSLRHRFATRAYQQSKDLLLVQQLMGHSKPETTAVYIGLDTADARRIIDKLRISV